ncbi:S-layer homology domain-containing protein [Patescibacteria group bacterium]|nr:S-layer homology domain-containing protein [Patescibacteria group bacterium]
MKKNIPFIFSFLFIFLKFLLPAYAEFQDVPDIYLYKNAINYAYESGIVSGYPDGNYLPDNSINRAEFTKIVINSQFSENEINNCKTSKTFSDINRNEWYYPYICVAVNKGIIDGYPDGSFKPGNKINFVEASKIIINAFGYKVSSSGIWYKPFVEAMENISAIPETVYSFERSITRGEMTEMVYRIKEKIKNKPSTNFYSEDNDTVGTTTFVKQYRMRDRAYAHDVFQTSDGGYVFVGETLSGFETDAFISKVLGNGQCEWTKLFQTLNTVTIIPEFVKTGEEIATSVVELKDGDYLMSGYIHGFIDDDYISAMENWGDFFFAKFDKNGNHIWTKIFGDYAADQPYELYATSDGGFLISGFVTKMGFGEDAINLPGYFVFVKFDSDGNVQWNKETRPNGNYFESKIDFKPDPSGGYIMVTEVPLPETDDLFEASLSSSMPTVVKMDKELNVEWAKTIEAIPMEYRIAVESEDELGYKWDYMKMRMPAGDFRAVEMTSDGGYLAIGTLSPITTGEMDTDVNYEFIHSPTLAGVKFDKNGNFEWAKTIKTEHLSNSRVDISVTKIKDDDFMIVRNVMGESTQYGSKYNTMTRKTEELYNICGDCSPSDIENDPELKSVYDAYIDSRENWMDTARNHLELIKVDDDFNVKWVKKIGDDRATYFGEIYPTSDYGVVISGQYHTDVLNFISSGIKFFFSDAVLIKLDINGNITGNDEYVSDYYSITIGNLTPYIKSYDLIPAISNFIAAVDFFKTPQTPVYSTKITSLSEAGYETVSLSDPGAFINFGLSVEPEIGTTTSWAKIYYDGIEPVETENKKSHEVHEELMPILNEIFDNKVKLRDNFGGLSLDYAFNRLIMKNDITAVQKYLENLGYETADANDNKLIMMKVGRTLNLLFSLTNKMRGTLNVTY